MKSFPGISRQWSQSFLTFVLSNRGTWTISVRAPGSSISITMSLQTGSDNVSATRCSCFMLIFYAEDPFDFSFFFFGLELDRSRPGVTNICPAGQNWSTQGFNTASLIIKLYAAPEPNIFGVCRSGVCEWYRRPSLVSGVCAGGTFLCM